MATWPPVTAPLLDSTAARASVAPLPTLRLQPQPRLELRVERIGAREHIIETGHRDVLGAALAQQARQRVHVLRRAVQGEHARRGRPAERRLDAEARPRLRDERVVAAGKTDAHLAEGARARLGGDAVEHDAG